MEIEVESSKIVKFLEVIEGKGTGAISECKIVSDADGLSCVATDAINSRVVKAILYKTVFKKYTHSDEPLVTMQLGRLISVLKRFDGMISIKVMNKRMVIASEKRDGDVALSSPDMITELTFPNFKYEMTFDTDASIFKESLSNSTAIESETFKLVGEKGFFKIVLGTDSGSALTEKVKAEVKDFEVYFKAGVDSCFKNFDGKIRVSASSNRPCLFEMKNKEMFITTILAPIDITKNLDEPKKEKKE